LQRQFFLNRAFGNGLLVAKSSSTNYEHSIDYRLDTTHKIVKITDFGLSRKCNINYNYLSQNAMKNLSPRWTAIEVLRDQYKVFLKINISNNQDILVFEQK
jgi:serine/threonine protein kinase